LLEATSLIKCLDRKSLFTTATEFSLALASIYSFFYVATRLGLRYFVLSNRGMIEHTTSGNILPGLWDVVVWAIALFVVLIFLSTRLSLGMVEEKCRILFRVGLFACFFSFLLGVSLVILGFINVVTLSLTSLFLLCLCFGFSGSLFGIGRSALLFRVLLGGLLVVLLIEVACFILFSAPVAFGFDVGALGLHWGLVELSFSNAAYPLLPYAYLLFVLVAVGGFVFRLFPNVWRSLVNRVRGLSFVECLSGFFDFGEVGRFGFGFLQGRLVVALAVVFSSVLSCLFVAFTVLPWSNPTGMLVSVDSPVYYNWISHMRSVDVNTALSFAFSNDRALFLLLCYVLSFFIPTLLVVQFAAALLLVLLSVVSVFVLRIFTNSTVVLSLGALLVPFSFQGLGLIYSGFFANMLALIFVFAYVALLFKLLAKWSTLGFLILLGVSIFILFSHSWTWFIFAVTLSLFLILELRSASANPPRFKDKTMLVGATIIVGLLIDLLRKAISPVSSTGSVFSAAQSSLGFPNIAYLISGMRESVDFVLGGVFANQLLVAVGLIGLFVLLKIKSEVSNFFVAWICVGCASILFAANSLLFNRALFMVPWILLSSFGLASIVAFVRRRLQVDKCSGYGRFLEVLVVLVFIFLVLLNSSLRYLFNINIW
jgi:hypothetical protein